MTRRGGVVAICHQCYQNWNSCTKEVKNKRTKEFCVAAVMPELWDETKGEGRKSIEDRQREDLELKLIIDFQEESPVARSNTSEF